MTLAPIIFAETDPAAKIIFITIFVLWVLGAIGKVLAGKSSGTRRLQESLQRTRQAMEQDQLQQARRRMPAIPPRLAPEIQRRLPPMMPARPAPMPRQAQMPKPMRAAPIQAKRVQKIPQPQSIKKAPLAQPMPEPVSPISHVPGSTKPAIQISAPALIRWLRPETLRQQFILTEIFQPPLALREQRE